MRSNQVFTSDQKMNPNPPPQGKTVADDQGQTWGQAAKAALASAAFGPQAQALARQGREDFLNTLWGQNLDRETGAPGEPTQQIVTDQIKDNEHDKAPETGRGR